MSTTTPLTFASQPITLDSPIQLLYIALERDDRGRWQLTEDYRNLPAGMRSYIIELAENGEEERGNRIANCMRAGSKSATCSRGKYARAARHRCGDLMCPNCSLGEVRAKKWADTRDHDALNAPQTGIEVKLPEAREDSKSSHLTCVLMRIVFLSMLSNDLMDALGRDAVMADAFGECVNDTAVRIICPSGTHTHKQIQWACTKAWRKITGERRLNPIPIAGAGDPICSIKHGSPVELFTWAFSGFREAACMSAGKKAALRIALKDHNTVRILGSTYSCLSKEKLAERRNQEPCLCPICKDHDLDIIPPAERHTQPIGDIQAEYEFVDWSAEHLSPFRSVEKDNGRREPTNNFRHLAESTAQTCQGPG